jgi:hypothetical protein
MFDSIVSKVITAVRNTVRAIGEATRRTPWLAPATILVLFLIW